MFQSEPQARDHSRYMLTNPFRRKIIIMFASVGFDRVEIIPPFHIRIIVKSNQVVCELFLETGPLH